MPTALKFSFDLVISPFRVGLFIAQNTRYYTLYEERDVRRF